MRLVSLRFVDTHADVTPVGPVGVGKTLKHARLDNSYEAELRKLIAIDLLLLDDFGLDVDPTESRDAYELTHILPPSRDRFRWGMLLRKWWGILLRIDKP